LLLSTTKVVDGVADINLDAYRYRSNLYRHLLPIRLLLCLLPLPSRQLVMCRPAEELVCTQRLVGWTAEDQLFDCPAQPLSQYVVVAVLGIG